VYEAQSSPESNHMCSTLALILLRFEWLSHALRVASIYNAARH